MTMGVNLIEIERARQIELEGFNRPHDDEHEACELAIAASSYLRHAVGQSNGVCDEEDQPAVPSEWPWDAKWWKPSNDPIRNLVKAGALIAAEIDRLIAARNS